MAENPPVRCSVTTRAGQRNEQPPNVRSVCAAPLTPSLSWSQKEYLSLVVSGSCVKIATRRCSSKSASPPYAHHYACVSPWGWSLQSDRPMHISLHAASSPPAHGLSCPHLAPACHRPSP